MNEVLALRLFIALALLLVVMTWEGKKESLRLKWNMPYSDSYIEKALRIEYGSIRRWERGPMAPEEVALTKILAVCPWLIEVADNNYDPEYIKTLEV